MKLTVGKIKVFLERTRIGMGWLQMATIVYIAIVTTGLNLLTTVLIYGVVFLAWGFIDFYYIMPREMEATARKNPEWLGLRAEVKLINADVKLIKEKVGA